MRDHPAPTYTEHHVNVTDGTSVLAQTIPVHEHDVIVVSPSGEPFRAARVLVAAVRHATVSPDLTTLTPPRIVSGCVRSGAGLMTVDTREHARALADAFERLAGYLPPAADHAGE